MSSDTITSSDPVAPNYKPYPLPLKNLDNKQIFSGPDVLQKMCSMLNNITSMSPKSADVFIFGDQTVPFETTLHTLLQVKDDPILTAFFDRVGYHLRRYVGTLPIHQQNWFPCFTTLVDLFAQHEKSHACPALKFSLLCTTQIAQYMRYYGQASRPFPTTDSTYLVGACTGSFAASAISISPTPSELLPVAVESVLVALKTAMLALIVREDLCIPDEDQKAWCAVVGIEKAVAEDLIEKFNTEKHLPRVYQLYISSLSTGSVSISGPPGLLPQFLMSSALKHSLLPIELPYHAPHLFPSQDIIGELHDPSLYEQVQRVKIISAASGEVHTSFTFEDLLRRAVAETLTRPLQCNLVVDCLATELAHHAFTSCKIWHISYRGSFISNALSQISPGLTVVTDFSIENPAIITTPTSGNFSHSKIAVIGYSGRFPDAASNEEFWDLLLAGRDVHRTIPPDRFNWERHYDATGKTKNTSRIKYGCFIKEPGVFDARFFNMSPREAENTDPAQRLGIMSAYEAIEMAGLVPNSTASTQQDRIGVFYGVTSDDWREVNSGQNVDTYFIPGGNRAFIPGRMSYFFRFCGPSLSIDTACSSSFAAIQTACAYLWRGECDTALAGGVNVLTNPDNFCGLDRNCNAFDDAADGYCRSDSIGSVLLKRLEDALYDNDPIFGVIRGAYTNHCDPLDVGYVEMHGTGTQAGDATEMKSVLSVFAPESKRNLPLHLGTAKANIGHAESASGVASMVKVLMMLKHSTIPPHCGIKTKINHTYPDDLLDRNIHIIFQPKEWKRDPGKKRLAFLNNFSAAGGNTAVLLEDAPEKLRSDVPDPRTRYTVAVTAKTVKSLERNIKNLVQYLTDNPDTSLSSLSYTTTARRMHQTYRVIVSGADICSIQNNLEKNLTKTHKEASNRPVVMVFSGQGTLYSGMGKQLFDAIPPFRDNLLRFNSIAERQGFPGFLSLIYGSTEDNVDQMRDHLALVCLQMALYTFWTSLGVKPIATIGHSLGEYPAMYASGVLSAADVIYLVGKRAELLAEKVRPRTHGMLAVRDSIVNIQGELDSACAVACFNQPNNNVISGPIRQLSSLKERLAVRGIGCTMLDVPFAFHSAQVDTILEDFKTMAQNIRYRAPQITYISPLLDAAVPAGDGHTLTAEYLTKACRRPVNFQGAIEAVQATNLISSKTMWLEIGSHPVCSGMVKGILGQDATTVASLRKNVDTWEVLTAGLEQLFLNGLDINWTEYHRPWMTQQEVLPLPLYSWDLKNYWIQYQNDFCLTKGECRAPAKDSQTSLFLSPSVQQILKQEHGTTTSTLSAVSDINDPSLSPILKGHVVHGAVLCPSSLYADVALTIATYMIQESNMSYESVGLDVADMQVQNPLVSQGKSANLYHVSATADWTANLISFRLFSGPEGNTTEHATFSVRITPRQTWLADWKRNTYLILSRIASLRASTLHGNAHVLKKRLAYQLFATTVEYGSDYQGMQEVVLDSDEHEATATTYQVYNRMQLEEGSTYLGDTYILEGDTVVALYEGVQFQGVPRRLLDRLLSGPKAAGQKVPQTNEAIPRQPQANSIAPKTDNTTARIMSIISSEAGVDANDMDPNDSFANYGIDSLLSLTISGRIQEETGTEVPSSLFAEYPTPNDLLNFLGASNTVSSATSDSVSGHETGIMTESASSDSILDTIRSTIASETGVAISDIKPATPFTDLGVDSLLGLTITSTLSETLGVDIPSTILADYPNLSEVGKSLGLDKSTPPPPPAKPVSPSSDATTGPQSTSVLLWGNTKTASKTIFFFPDGSGSATSYAHLPKIPDTAAYGLNCPYMKTPHDMNCSLEELTAKYILQIRRRQPTGPYYLAGWSAGGICAYEAARQLSDAGESTARLVLIDAPNPIGLENPPQRMYDFFDEIGVFGANGTAPSWLRPHFDAFIRLLDAYKISPFNLTVRTHLIYATLGVCHDGPKMEIRPDDPREMVWLLNDRKDFSGDGWASLVGRPNLHITVLDGVNHFSMMERGEHMSAFGQFLQRAMN
ncbi:hypothetical protein EYZ11_003822 [Aspergillus tanneri]|uniref:Type I Polyketide synthases (Type I PKS) n=1 Tax=Aspergillus tanneri TaxID=1220188 RepID=A0A4S3JM92_9EURO|nr:hypothetical protein EYZ11_003822 [Aspergillus tanneri]